MREKSRTEDLYAQSKVMYVCATACTTRLRSSPPSTTVLSFLKAPSSFLASHFHTNMARTTSPPSKSPRISATPSIEPYSPLRSDKSGDVDLDNDGADVSISTAKTSPNTSTASGSQKHVVADVIAESFPPYDHQSSLVVPFERELEQGVQFRERESGI